MTSAGTSARSGELTAAVALRAAGTMAGRGADMLLPHIQRRGSWCEEVSNGAFFGLAGG